MKHYQIEIEIYEGKSGQFYKEGGEIINPENIAKEGIGA